MRYSQSTCEVLAVGLRFYRETARVVSSDHGMLDVRCAPAMQLHGEVSALVNDSSTMARRVARSMPERRDHEGLADHGSNAEQ
jgi:hypothetical protein